MNESLNQPHSMYVSIEAPRKNKWKNATYGCLVEQNKKKKNKLCKPQCFCVFLLTVLYGDWFLGCRLLHQMEHYHRPAMVPTFNTWHIQYEQKLH